MDFLEETRTEDQYLLTAVSSFYRVGATRESAATTTNLTSFFLQLLLNWAGLM